MMLDPFLKSQPPAYRHSIRSCSAWYWIYLRRGSLHARANGHLRQLGPETLLVLPVGLSVDLSTPASTGYHGLSITVLPPDSEAVPGKAPFLIRPSACMGRLVGLLEEGLGKRDRRSMAYCRHLAKALLEETRFILHKDGASARALSDVLLDRVEEDLRRSVYTGERVAELLSSKGLSSRQVERLFKARHGVSAKAWLMERKLEQARLWLERPQATASGIAGELGFSSAQHFITWFRRKTGKTPMKEKRSHP